jgi:uncharacterized protein (DUF924 family)
VPLADIAAIRIWRSGYPQGILGIELLIVLADESDWVSRMSPSGALSAQTDWAVEVLRFWFTELTRQQWFARDAALDEQILSRFMDVHRMVATAPEDVLSADAKTALAAVIVLDQFSRNMFRGTPSAFANDAKALAIAQKAIAKSFGGALSSDEQLFLYLPFEHQENVDAQARSVELISALGDPELTKYAQAHKDVIDRFGRFPHRNAILGRTSTAEELEFLKGQGSSF